MKLRVAVCLNLWLKSSESLIADLSICSRLPEPTRLARFCSTKSLGAVSMKQSSVTDTVTLHLSFSDSADAYALLRASFTRLPNGQWKMAFLLPDASM